MAQHRVVFVGLRVSPERLPQPWLRAGRMEASTAQVHDLFNFTNFVVHIVTEQRVRGLAKDSAGRCVMARPPRGLHGC